MAAPNEALSLYRSFLRAARHFNSYNFREYVQRRSRDAFIEHRQVSDPARIQQLLQEARDQLVVAQRQARINALYSHDRLVLEH
ncbi:hypothetical protein H4R33_004122 [Dimargaris cristalligena]|uniref:LYR motif-containing protein 4B-like protein n=1 Tax=Dimargaris cristalligena TaxID=215637 RepID=A0A4V1J4S8_9FUNG|nr:hypothetical protein H4R33_004122 [Dimargaris cristalligena]RKP36609.1 LYR motif-containing protein 4B-like protein [Dimargaris cristalligena]|eukprot:RKP36609.1 LYR motif-containing protein 4B-like protein [Dimargaris cristalligena]